MTLITLPSEYANAASQMSAPRGQHPRPRQGVRTAALISADVIGFVVAVVCSVAFARAAGADLVWWSTAAGTPHFQAAILTDVIALGGVMLYFAQYAHYSRRIPFWSELRDVLMASVVALLCSGFVQFSLQLNDSRLLVGLTWALFPITVIVSRRLVRRLLLRAGLWQLRAVVVASPETARQAEGALLSEPELGYKVAAVVPPSRVQAWPETGQWREVLYQQQAELLVLALDPGARDAREITESLVRERVPFAVVPRLDGLPVLGFDQTCFFSHDTVMFSYRNNLAHPVARLTKIVFDLFASICLLTVLSPVMLAIAIAVKLDGGPVLYAHRRIGAGGREFPCFKFRSMVVDGDAVLRRLLETDPAAAEEWASTQKLRRDPRVTLVGRTLRATSLDEIPQLFNVLRLEMSLVGPRPIVRAEVPRYGSNIAFYYETRPGVTGLWQVSGRSDTGYAHRVYLDTWYVKNWTLWHDLAILAKTIPAVLERRGAV